MQHVTIRELMNEGSAEPVAGAEHVTTFRGQTVANVPPVDPPSAEDMSERIAASKAFWARWDALAAKIGASIQTDLTAAEMVAEQRRIL
ncbi:MAG: hypothetical protein ABI780_11100 [Ardenticatenales bacterium]